MKKLIEFFQLTRKEQRGMFLLILLNSLLLTVNIFLPVFHKQKDIQFSMEEMAFSKESTSKPAPASYIKSKQNKHKHNKKSSQELFKFNPNVLDKAGWVKLGLSDKQAQVVLNYREKGGVFKNRDDLKKIYVLDEELLVDLLPFVEIPQTDNEIRKPTVLKDKISKDNYMNLGIDINLADSSEFMKLKGIGPVFSSRIIKFRDALGGFVKTEQLSEIYGLPEETYQHIFPKLTVDRSDVKLLKINVISVSELSKHPYVTYKQAQTIINYRNQHGGFNRVEDLSKIHSLDEDFFRKIEFYLDFTEH
ncbi:comEA protein [Sphingobacterium daejeonense]|nr:comEA protein [Sphingobacterium daejeonense]